MAKFFYNSLKREKDQPKNRENQPPKPLKHRLQQLSDGFQPEYCPDAQSRCDLHTNVTAANSEAQIQPGLKADQDKQQVAQGIAPAPQRT